MPQGETIAIHCAACCPICRAKPQETRRTISDKNRLLAMLDAQAAESPETTGSTQPPVE